MWTVKVRSLKLVVFTVGDLTRGAAAYYPATTAYVVKYVRDCSHCWTPSLPFMKWTLNLWELVVSHRPNLIEKHSNGEHWEVPTAVDLVCTKADNHGSFTIALHCCKLHPDDYRYMAKALCYNVFTESYFTLSWAREPLYFTVPRNELQRVGIPSQPSERNFVWNMHVYDDCSVSACGRTTSQSIRARIWQPELHDLRSRRFNYDLTSTQRGVYFGNWPTHQLGSMKEPEDSHSMYFDDDFAVFCHGAGFTALKRIIYTNIGNEQKS